MIEFTTTRFRCEHCRKTLASRSRMRRHEATCAHDPAQRSCLTCQHHYLDGANGDGCDKGHHIAHPVTRGCEGWSLRETTR